MKVDVLIPTYKPDKEFIKLLQMLPKQTLKPHKIIIMNTEEVYFERLLFDYPRLHDYADIEVHHVAKREFDHGGTRHMGMTKSQADIVVCMTQDAVLAGDDTLEQLVRPLVEDCMVAVSYARQLPKEGASLSEQYTRSFNYPETEKRKTLSDIETMGIKAFFCSDVCAAYNRAIYLKLGGFIRHTIFNEDMIFANKALKAGYDVFYAAKARVFHSHEYTFMQQIRRNFDLGVSQADHPEVFEGISSEKEGKKMVMGACRHFLKIGKPFELVHLISQSAAKYIGYFLGKRYKKLPRRLVEALTMSKTYWEGL